MYKEDCFWLEQINDMGAIIHFCYLCADEDNWKVIDSCSKSCINYISKAEAKTVIKSWQNNRKK